MNPLPAEELILESFAIALANAYPARIVTRDLKDFSDRKADQLKKGIFTVIADGLPAADDYFQTMKFLVVGQIQVGEKDAGRVIELAELKMFQELRVLIQRRLLGPELKIGSVEQSAQLERPYGWVSMSLTAGPYDATEPLTEDENVGGLADFLRFRADLDINQPHQSGAVHQEWLDEPPNYERGEPDAQMQVDLPRSPS